MKYLVSVMVLLGLTFGIVFAVAETTKPTKSNKEEILMRAKLASTQKILEGLVAKDFTHIQKGGEELVHASDADDWAETDDQAYEHFRREFRRQAQKLATFGEQQNLEAANYTYLSLITTCVECHSHCRDVLRIAAELPNLKPVPQPTADGRFENDSQRPIRR